MALSILIVDDSESIRELVGYSLEQQGFNVIRCVDGQDAIDKLQGSSVDLIISDLNMPVKDGIELVKEVRSQEEHQFLPILILTTESESKKRQQAKDAGATGWIIKPFDEQRLLKIIHKVVRS